MHCNRITMGQVEGRHESTGVLSCVHVLPVLPPTRRLTQTHAHTLRAKAQGWRG